MKYERTSTNSISFSMIGNREPISSHQVTETLRQIISEICEKNPTQVDIQINAHFNSAPMFEGPGL